mmetsp:Transcript_14381/g.21111  ORF Transcript_14381/g.21111 Transcript_14381/m.21111 type:complete len:215 (+) Transcript_14381:840-1484(+)
MHAPLPDRTANCRHVRFGPDQAGQREFRAWNSYRTEVLNRQLDNTLCSIKHCQKCIIRRPAFVFQKAISAHTNNWHVSLRFFTFGNQVITKFWGKFRRLPDGKFAHCHTRVLEQNEVIRKLIYNPSYNGGLFLLDITPLLVRKTMSIIRYSSFQLNGEIMDRIFLEIMPIPQVVTACMEKMSINRDHFGVIPRSTFSPCSDPQLNIRTLVNELG